MAKPPPIPRVFLYGDPPEDVETDFLHVEPIHVRSGRYAWRIAPHTHPNHTQLLLVRQGGGTIGIDGTHHQAQSPCALLIPSGTVHWIEFTAGTDGVVATIADALLRPLAAEDPALAATLRRAHCLPLTHTNPALAAFAPALEGLLQEFVWQAPGRRTAIAAHLRLAVVTLLRCAVPAPRTAEPARRSRMLVERYRELIETHFRSQHRVGFYAGAAHVTVARLNAACRNATGRSATSLLSDRIILEAKRALLYTNLGIAEVAQSLGFDDAAYFTRVFTRAVGVAPKSFRSGHAVGVGAKVGP